MMMKERHTENHLNVAKYGTSEVVSKIQQLSDDMLLKKMDFEEKNGRNELSEMEVYNMFAGEQLRLKAVK